MVKKSFIIKAEAGLHARPATLFVNKSKEFDSDIKVIKDNKEVDGKRFFQVLSLGVVKDDLIHIEIQGQDEEQAMNELEKLIINGLTV